jgi:hypothetical protein
MKLMTSNVDRLLLSAGVILTADGIQIVGVLEAEGATNAAEEMVDILQRAYAMTSRRMTPAARLEDTGEHEGFRLIRLTDIEAARSPLSQSGGLELGMAAKGNRLVVVLAERTQDRLQNTLKPSLTGARGLASQATFPENVRFWTDMEKLVPLATRFAGGADNPAVGMVLGLAAMVFEEGSQELSLSLRLGERGALIRGELPPGFYAILGQLVNLGLAQLSRQGS